MKATSAGTPSRHCALDHQHVELARARLAEDLARGLEAEDDAGLLLHDPRPRPRASAGTVASAVTSPAPMSSASAAATSLEM